MSKNNKSEKHREIYEIAEKEHRKYMHGDQIRKIRANEDLSREKLSEILDVSSDTICLIEQGKSTLSPKKALIINDKYGYSLDWIYGISGKGKREYHDDKHKDRIYEIRCEKKLSQQKLAEILHVTNKTISAIELGSAVLSADKALILNKKYGYTIDWIYGIDCNKTEINPAFYVDIRNVIKIKSTSIKNMKYSAEEKQLSTSIKETKKLVITIGDHIFKYLEALGDIEKRKKDKVLSDKEYSLLIDELNKDYQYSKDLYCRQGEIPLDDMKVKTIEKDMPIIVT